MSMPEPLSLPSLLAIIAAIAGSRHSLLNNPPMPLSLPTASPRGTDKFSAEHALVWLDSMHNDPTFNATWHLFWEAHPDRDGVFAPDVSWSPSC